ncbi:3-oxoacyl-[acyl-carrier-protein] reductase [Sulfolobus sp. A20]|uniref:3-oxoacyl-ACP reductase FabG n=1 Tax=Sulfolobaceae TaxID=118883 RepID=UPI00084623B8|nr:MULTISPECIES: 3-oxoacyl-ACP reductase FabG [unclassified Sulfolobus]TRM77097.1 3-oxoacyl-ACP reductase FabG [Sulfolobus sp. A20-N-F8]TRM81339.1 3-oxoacyl-ACP reductase FabG [Sulfolobus sp. D5]TRM83148.1 3-oxoacyl-ACP reductase FabG [Sulfolobus sp. A20-N-F6]TRM87650.1 3-oxoacyl-ACP reductase FabG [Sulfolobus sp. C3]TRN00673.1 3-oxoacyl-ACP reductase FabG [Sulfolobus sp. E1]
MVRYAIITGAGSGIGFATSVKLASLGYGVIMGDISENIQERANKIREITRNEKVIGLRVDVTDWNSCREFYNKALLELNIDHVDILVNNAGIIRDSLFTKMTPEQWDQVIKVHLYGTFNMTKQVVEGMIKYQWGRIINMSSASWRGNIGQANYSAAKAGIIGFTLTLSRELGKYNITTNAIVPGFIDTPMTASVPEKVRKIIIDRIPMSRIGKPEEVANVIAFLSSDEASYINGAIIEVTGGLTL